MSGTRAGGLKASKTNKERHGDGFYARIGKKGGTAPTSKPKGFAANRALAKVAGAKGGKASRRGPAKRDEDGKIVKKSTPKFKVAKPVINPEPKPGIFKRIFGGK